MELGGWQVLSLPAIAEQDETIAIGDNEFHQRRAGEALHPELESRESLERSNARSAPMCSRRNSSSPQSRPAGP